MFRHVLTASAFFETQPLTSTYAHSPVLRFWVLHWFEKAKGIEGAVEVDYILRQMKRANGFFIAQRNTNQVLTKAMEQLLSNGIPKHVKAGVRSWYERVMDCFKRFLKVDWTDPLTNRFGGPDISVQINALTGKLMDMTKL